jgi:hypothetical protein
MNTPAYYPGGAVGPAGAIFGPVTGYANFTQYRMYVLSAAANGGTPGVSAPAAGVVVDGVGTPGNAGYPALPGLLVLVESGIGAFAAGAALETDAFGRAVPHAAGIVVLRALEASAGAGTIVQAVFSR